MEEYNKNDNVEDVKENISAVEEFTDTEKENEQDLLLKQGAVNSLERMFKLWWIPRVVRVISFIAIFFEIVLVVFAKHMSYPLLMIAGIGLLCLTGLIIAVSAGISAIAWLVLLYRYWKFLPAGEACTTPAKAVGYLFIPVFNLYWIFVSFWKMSRSYDKLMGRKNSCCTVIACLYAVFFSISTLGGYISQFAVFFPEFASFARIVCFATTPCVILYIVAVCCLQNTVRKYLQGPAANWKNNPDFSKFPLVAGLVCGLLFIVFMSFFSVTAAITQTLYKQDTLPQKEGNAKVTQSHTHSHHK